MPRKQTLRLKTRARLLTERDDSMIPMASVSSLKDDLRQLYERSSLTVRAIATLAGISERMLYKYAEQGRWADRETRLSRQMMLLNPAQAKEIAMRAAKTVRMSDEAAAQEIARVKARRAAWQGRRTLEQNMRVYELLAGALAELARTWNADVGDVSRGLSGDLQQLLSRQMEEAFDGQFRWRFEPRCCAAKNVNKTGVKTPVPSCRRLRFRS